MALIVFEKNAKNREPRSPPCHGRERGEFSGRSRQPGRRAESAPVCSLSALAVAQPRSVHEGLAGEGSLLTFAWIADSPAAREAARCLGSPVLSPRHRPGAGGLARVQWRAQARSAALDLDTGRGGRVRKTLEKMAESTNPGLPRQRGDPLGLE